MKLVMCRKCNDIVTPCLSKIRKCFCGQVSTKCIDKVNICYTGEANIIGFNNISLALALLNTPKSGLGKNFIAFVIPTNCPSVHKVV